MPNFYNLVLVLLFFMALYSTYFFRKFVVDLSRLTYEQANFIL
jgi:hypothetical protein